MKLILNTRERMPGKVKDFLLWSDDLFPNQEIYVQRFSLKQQLGIFILMAIVFTLAGSLIPANGYFAFDWVHFFGGNEIPLYYPPWVDIIISFLSWPSLVGLSLAAVALAILKRAVHPISAVFAFLTLPLFWTIFLGQLEGLVVLGLLGLPWLAPLALIKPQISLFAFGSRREHILAGAIVVVVSILIWGFWPIKLVGAVDYYKNYGYVQDISLKWWGFTIALPLLWFSRGDPDMLLVAGSFATLHLIPYNLLPIVPGIARLRPGVAALACVFTWLPLLANWLGPVDWWLAWIFIFWLWINLALIRYRSQA